MSCIVHSDIARTPGIYIDALRGWDPMSLEYMLMEMHFFPIQVGDPSVCTVTYFNLYSISMFPIQSFHLPSQIAQIQDVGTVQYSMKHVELLLHSRISLINPFFLIYIFSLSLFFLHSSATKSDRQILCTYPVPKLATNITFYISHVSPTSSPPPLHT